MNLSYIQNYLARVFSRGILLSEQDMNVLPLYVRRQFQFFAGELYNRTIHLLVSKDDFFAGHTIRELESSDQIFRSTTSAVPVFVFSSLSKNERQMLITRGISFVVPEVQMFMPFLGIDLFERIPEKRAEKRALRPAAQALLIEQLLSGRLQGLTLNKAATVMGYSAMGVLRAADQLNDLDLCNVAFDGFKKTLNFNVNRKTLWNNAIEHLRNPVKKIVSIEDDSWLPPLPAAGEFALKNHSSISVNRKCYALTQAEFSGLLKEQKIILTDAPGYGVADLQIWSYVLPSWDSEVDLFSLGLSFGGNTDPRIKIALLDIEERRKW